VWEDAIRNSNAAVHYNTSLLINPQDEAMSHSEEHSAELVKKLSTYVSHEEFLDFAILFDRNFNIVAHSSGWTGCYKDEELLNEAKSAGGDALLKIVAGADNTPLIPISIKIRDEDDQPIGTSIVFFNLEKVLASVGISRIETDGFFVVTDAERIVLFSPGVKPFSKKFLSYNQFEKLVSSDDGYIMANIDKNRGDKKIVIMSTVSIGAISSENESLMVFFELDASRAFNPLRQLVSYLFLICLILGIIIVPMGQIAGNAFISPINKLRWATDEVLAGNWDHQIKIKTGDEIQLLSEAFNEMILRIKVKQDQLVTANQALADFSINLEKKVEERTTELSKTHEAMLNLLEDLTEAKLNLEKVLKIKSDFTAMVSHELRTPLAAIKEGIAIVSDGTTGELNPRQKEFLDIARKNVDRLSRLINSILISNGLNQANCIFILSIMT
jgi:methyl-accepting chemotaxis protein